MARTEVLAILAYDEDGTPVAFPAGRKRDRVQDREAIGAWMLAVASQENEDER